jgi:hypothetical protein
LRIGTWLGWIRDADKAKVSRAPDRRSKTSKVVKSGDRADKPQRHDAGGARGKNAQLLGHEQPSACGKMPADSAKSSAPTLSPTRRG